MNEQKLDLILSELRNVHVEVAKVHGHVTEVNERVTELSDRVTEVNDRVTELSDRVTEVNDRVTDVSIRLSKVEVEQQRHGNLIEQLIQQVETTNYNLSEFEKKTDQRFHQTDRYLRMLDSDIGLILKKSNEHEREINRLQQAE